MAELRISTEKVCFIIAKARAFHVKAAPVVDDYGSNPSDEEAAHPILEDRAGDATDTELRDAIAGLDGGELADLIGLSWLGRDADRDADDWDEILAEVADQAPERPVDALMEQPLLAEMLEEGLDAFGLSCGESGEAIAPDARVLPE